MPRELSHGANSGMRQCAKRRPGEADGKGSFVRGVWCRVSVSYRFQIRRHALKNPDDGHVFVIGDAASQSLTGLGNPLHCCLVRVPAPFRALDRAIRNVANPATIDEIIDDDFYGLRVLFDERRQRGRERRSCRWSAGERIQGLPVTPRQAVRVERPFEASSIRRSRCFSQ
jgi:hypothetical protein